ncbi:uncharacterized protein Nmlp_3368 [Natronomonas moolapensis 8.8.11]|uniref:LppX domain protein n=1 Tax=Natronomonas moolapensis (strain DSM 18674 / CECT 7526 / JCM 14361 / 8.8.11) TaxID=268739 RepID=M1XSX4_NATM8|nr:hypothetical protein [Natronomonas moolapensis]CCQ37497.1 uncharacterized protein Nmlp_3368 [Natronomonas moolapensis 8.8.11]
MFRSNRTSTIAAVLLCLAVAGCSGALPGESGQADAAAPEVDVADIEANADELERYRVERTRTLRSPRVNETIEIGGTVDTESRRARLSMRTETNVGAGVRTSETEQYVAGDTQYTRDGDGGEWERSEGSWTDTETFGDAVETLEGATFEPIRTETIDGTETTMFRVNVTANRRDKLLGTGDDQHATYRVEDFLYYVFIDTETDTLYGTDLRMEISQGGGGAVLTIETVFTGHNGGFEVSPPDSIELSDDG